MHKMICKSSENILKIFFLLVIVVLCAFNLNSPKTISVIGDEFGYWSAAAFFNNIDWNSVASINPYYSYGYGILLSVIMALFKNPLIMYKVAIVLNIALVCGIFFLIYFCAKKFFPHQTAWKLLCLSFIVTVYPSNLYFTQLTMVEIFLTFTYWGILAVFLENQKDERLWKEILLTFLSIFIFFVHQRCLGITVAAMACLLLDLLKNRKYRKLVFLIVSAVIFCFIGLYIKNIYQDYLFSTAISSDTMAQNDFGGQIGKITYLLSFEGIFAFIKSVLGKVFYMGTATFLVSYFSIALIVKKCFKFNNALKRISFEWVAGLFILLSVVFSIAIASIFMIDFNGRFDLLIYGRYFEFTIGPLLLIGIGKLLEIKLPYRYVFLTVLMHIVLTICIYQWIDRYSTTSRLVVNTAAIADMIYLSSDIEIFLFCNLLRAICIWLLLYFVCNYFDSKKRYILFTFVFGLAWCFTYYYTTVKGLNSWRERENNDNIVLANMIDSIRDEIELCYYYSLDDESIDNIDYLQYLLLDQPIACQNVTERTGNVQENTLIITNRNSSVAKYLPDNVEWVYDSLFFSLYAPKESNVYKEIATRMRNIEFENMSVDDNNTDINNDGIYIQGDNNYAIYGPYIGLPRADYMVSFEISCHAGEGVLGYCDISIDGGDSILKKVEIEHDSFDDKNILIQIPFSLYKYTKDIEFRVYVNEGAELELTSIYYQQFPNSYSLGMDDETEIKRMVTDIQNLSDVTSVVYMNSNEDEIINLSYLQSMLPEYQFSIKTFDDIILSSSTEYQYVIADKAYTDWFKILSDYVVIEQYKNYILLVSKEAVLENERKLSFGEYADLSLIQKMDENLYLSGKYDLREGGEFSVILEPLVLENTEENLRVEILSGEAKLDTITDIKYDEFITFAFHSDIPINELSFHIYSSAGKEIAYTTGKIKLLKDCLTYTYDQQLRPLLDISKMIPNTDNSISMIAETWREEDIKNLSKYLNGYEVKYFEYNKEAQMDKSSSNIKTYGKVEVRTLSQPEEPWIIASANVPMIYEMLSDYTVAGRTDWYVLLVKTENMEMLKQTGLKPLSEKMQLFADFFRSGDNQNAKNWSISIPEGTYEVNFDLQRVGDCVVDGEEIQVQIWNGETLYETQNLDIEEQRIEFSCQEGLRDVRFEIMEHIPGTIIGEMSGITRLSTGYEVKLSQMNSYYGEYNDNDKCIITSGDTIYGPYSSLAAGQYNVIFKYETSSPDQIRFDIASDGGIVLIDSSMSIPVENKNGYQVSIPLDVETDLNQVEFRTYVPEGVEFTLQSITVLMQ